MNIIQDFYYTSEFKKSYEFNYDFTIPLDVNIDLKPNEKIKFKLINFSMMNSMLNISSFHKNNIFKIRYLNVDSFITIPDGSYTATSLRDWINSYMSTHVIPIAFNYDKSINKYWLLTSEGIISGDLIFYPLNCAALFGFTKPSYNLIYPNEYYGESFVNMLPYSKIVLITNLTFETNVQFNFNVKYNSNNGINNIVCWIPRDQPLFSTINYTNINNLETNLADRNIKSINFSLMNEYQEYIYDAHTCYLYFQLIIYKTSENFMSL